MGLGMNPWESPNPNKLADNFAEQGSKDPQPIPPLAESKPQDLVRPEAFLQPPTLHRSSTTMAKMYITEQQARDLLAARASRPQKTGRYKGSAKWRIMKEIRAQHGIPKSTKITVAIENPENPDYRVIKNLKTRMPLDDGTGVKAVADTVVEAVRVTPAAKPVKAVAAKKAPAKTVAAKKPAVKKAPAKAVAKPAVKKAPAKPVAAKKAVAKPAAKKVVAKPAAKKTVAKAPAKKVAAKKAA